MRPTMAEGVGASEAEWEPARNRPGTDLEPTGDPR